MTPPPVPVYRTRSLFLLGEEQRRLFELIQEKLSTHHEVTRDTRALLNLADKLKPEFTRPWKSATLGV
jgi:hypothetical protein